ncbi:MAG: hypothetical protein IT303_19840 [Dehalococcoidia bacterium]|nr:hypothetical protein [Dehalococcoidia bacterium]
MANRLAHRTKILAGPEDLEADKRALDAPLTEAERARRRELIKAYDAFLAATRDYDPDSGDIVEDIRQAREERIDAILGLAPNRT